jgi:hypothetical protein
MLTEIMKTKAFYPLGSAEHHGTFADGDWNP